MYTKDQQVLKQPLVPASPDSTLIQLQCGNSCSESESSSSSYENNRFNLKRNKEIPVEPLKLVFAIIFLTFGGLATHTSRAFASDRVPNAQPLPDLLLDNIPYLHWGRSGSEAAMALAVMMGLMVLFFHKHGHVVLRRVFFQLGLHYFYRSILMSLTVLPKPNTHYACAEKLEHPDLRNVALRIYELWMSAGLKVKSKHEFCGDYIYSGHTMVMILSYLVVVEHGPKNWYILRLVMLLNVICGILLLLLGRGHYSIDILISYWITSRIWGKYYDLLKRNDGLATFDDCWWHFIFNYLEANTGKLPQIYRIPLPRKLARRFQLKTAKWSNSSKKKKKNSNSHKNF